MKKSIVQRAALILLLAATVPAAAAETWPVRIEWAPVKGARAYTVEVRNRQGKELYKRNVATGYAVFNLGSGMYRVRITALNVFMKPGSSSGWSTLAVRKREETRDESEGGSPVQIGRLGRNGGDSRLDESRKKEEALRKEEDASKREEKYRRGLAGLGPLDIALGGSYHFPVTRWKQYLNPAPGAHVTLSYRLSGIGAVKSIPVLSNFGLALKFGIIPFSGWNRYGADLALLSMSPAAGIFYDFNLGVVKNWAFDLRLAMFLGPSISHLKSKGLFKVNRRAVNFFYDPQVSFRFCYNGYFFIETGAGFHSVQLYGQPLSSVYPFLQAGIRL